MKVDANELENRINALLSDTQYNDHPLRSALHDLWTLNQDQCERVEKITQLSDSYQNMMLRREKSLSDRFNKQLKQIEKITRISDLYQKNLHEMNVELEKASLIDPLTGLSNRRMITRHLRREVKQALLHNHSLGIAIIDVDYFKKVNDAHGHQIGDEVLVSLSQIMASNLGSDSFCGRWGGEEFLILINHIDKKSFIKTIDSLREKIENAQIDISPNITIRITVSIGLSILKDDDEDGSFFSRADKALFKAKNAGRNNIVFFD